VSNQTLQCIEQSGFGAPARLGFIWTLEEIASLPEVPQPHYTGGDEG
jgi:hypothetical protein